MNFLGVLVYLAMFAWPASTRANDWHPVNAPAPDSGIVSLDPNRLAGSEEELQRQLQSTPVTPSLIENVRQIYLKSQDRKTRFLALEALGRPNDPRTEEVLIQLYPLASAANTHHILSMLKPPALKKLGVSPLRIK